MYLCMRMHGMCLSMCVCGMYLSLSLSIYIYALYVLTCVHDMYGSISVVRYEHGHS